MASVNTNKGENKMATQKTNNNPRPTAREDAVTNIIAAISDQLEGLNDHEARYVLLLIKKECESKPSDWR